MALPRSQQQPLDRHRHRIFWYLLRGARTHLERRSEEHSTRSSLHLRSLDLLAVSQHLLVLVSGSTAGTCPCPCCLHSLPGLGPACSPPNRPTVHRAALLDSCRASSQPLTRSRGATVPQAIPKSTHATHAFHTHRPRATPPQPTPQPPPHLPHAIPRAIRHPSADGKKVSSRARDLID